MRVRSIFFGLLILALLGGVYVDSRVRDAVGDQRWRFKNESRVVTAGCGTVEYGVAGSGDPVLVVHGSGGGFDQGIDAAKILAERGFTLLAPSRFGYLRSPVPPQPTAAAQADALACLVGELQLAPRMPVLGLSAGASSAVEFCSRHAERCSALVLVVPALATPSVAPRATPMSAFQRRLVEESLQSDIVLWLATKLVPAQLIESLLATPALDVAHAAPDEQQRVAAVLRGLLPIRDRAAGLVIDSRPPAPIDANVLVGLGVPVLLVSADDDLYGTAAVARDVAARVPGARAVTYRDGGHLLVGHYLEAWGAIEEFLRNLPAPRPSP
jgi:pimeloyl-ACP methyl ester carboxylesterase